MGVGICVNCTNPLRKTSRRVKHCDGRSCLCACFFFFSDHTGRPAGGGGGGLEEAKRRRRGSYLQDVVHCTSPHLIAQTLISQGKCSVAPCVLWWAASGGGVRL